ncbi:MAG: hypothetical protein IPM97_00230 [Bdellovibrionaceae bacterium]|nr:hypothetical protein [Pseudobdellovibrionaceae bacterium]
MAYINIIHQKEILPLPMGLGDIQSRQSDENSLWEFGIDRLKKCHSRDALVGLKTLMESELLVYKSNTSAYFVILIKRLLTMPRLEEVLTFNRLANRTVFIRILTSLRLFETQDFSDFDLRDGSYFITRSVAFFNTNSTNERRPCKFNLRSSTRGLPKNIYGSSQRFIHRYKKELFEKNNLRATRNLQGLAVNYVLLEEAIRDIDNHITESVRSIRAKSFSKELECQIKSFAICKTRNSILSEILNWRVQIDLDEENDQHGPVQPFSSSHIKKIIHSF